MIRLHEITRAIIEHESSEFGTEFSLSDIKSLDNMVNENFNSDKQTYVEPINTKFTYLYVPKDSLDYIWSESLRDLFDDCYAHDIPENLRKYIDYESFIDDCKEDGRPNYFNGYDGSTEIETENYYIYYHNNNYR